MVRVVAKTESLEGDTLDLLSAPSLDFSDMSRVIPVEGWDASVDGDEYFLWLL